MLLLTIAASAKLSVKEPCSNGMILQQNTNATIWGHATPGIRVSVTTGWDGRTYDADTDGKGVWKAKVATPEASYTKYEIKINGDGGQLAISDVLIGEVWIASGQSNMEMPVIGYFNCPVEGSAEIIANTKLRDKVRMFSVRQDQSEVLLDDVKDCTGWMNAEGHGIAWMSATAFFFAMNLQRQLDVPVGIVAFPYGGTRVAAREARRLLLPQSVQDVQLYAAPYAGLHRKRLHLVPGVLQRRLPRSVRGEDEPNGRALAQGLGRCRRIDAFLSGRDRAQHL